MCVMSDVEAHVAEYICRFCGKEVAKQIWAKHELFCGKNPNRPCKGKGRRNKSREALKIRLKEGGVVEIELTTVRRYVLPLGQLSEALDGWYRTHGVPSECAVTTDREEDAHTLLKC